MVISKKFYTLNDNDIECNSKIDDANFLEDLKILLGFDNSFTSKLDEIMKLLIDEGLVPDGSGHIKFLSG